jgi:hypothetical protein
MLHENSISRSTSPLVVNFNQGTQDIYRLTLNYNAEMHNDKLNDITLRHRAWRTRECEYTTWDMLSLETGHAGHILYIYK